MKKSIVFAALSALISIPAVHAAGGGTINFTGKVVNQTCNVSVNGGTATALVTLPSIHADQLISAGDVAGQTTFNMDITGCASATPGGNTVKAFFEGGATVDAAGRLKNTASTNPATNVLLELVDGNSNTAIKVGDNSQITDNYIPITNGSASLLYGVRYYSTGVTGAGDVSSNVTYSLIYN